MLECSTLHGCEELDQRLQITIVGGFQHSNVTAAVIVSNNQRKPIRPNEDQGGQRTCQAAVPVLERMDLDKSMMQPSGLRFWRNVFVFAMPRD